MLSVLLVNNNNIDKSPIISILEEFPNVYISKSETVEEALELFSKRYFEILFLDSTMESVESLEKFKIDNPSIVIISVYTELDHEVKDAALEAGISDYLSNSTDTKLLKQRISNYIDLARFKKEQTFYSDAINLFDKDINRRYVTFKLTSNESKLEFWDYFSSSYFERYHGIAESIDLIYAFTSWMFLNKRECEVVKETDDENMYLTLQPLDYMSEGVVSNLIEKYSSGTNYKVSNHKLSLKLTDISKIEKNTNVSKLDDETKTILSKTHFNKISAQEFVESTALELMNKIEDLSDLEDRIDQALISFENNPNTDTTELLSEEIMEYVDVIEMLVHFQHLAYALKTLANAIKNIKQEQMQEKEVKKFTTLSLHLLHDLSLWRENIFIKQEANDIHYLDSSLLSSCLQIEAIFEKEKIEEDEDDFELF
jgi:two-component system chemotaxis response regulator CheY